MTSATLALPSNPPALRQELPSFCIPENVCLIAAGATALVVSAIAIALLFTPVGAGVVGMGLLIGCAVMTGGAGLVGIGTIFYEYVGHKEHCERIGLQNAAIDRREQAEHSASAVLMEFCRIPMENPTRIAIMKGAVPLTDADKGLLAHCQSRLPHDFCALSDSISWNFPHVVPHYLAFLFFGADAQVPLISMKPASIDVDEWWRLELLAQGAERYERAVRRGETDYQVHGGLVGEEIISTMEQDKQGMSDLINSLKAHFATRPGCVTGYLVLYSLYCRGFDAASPMNESSVDFCVDLLEPALRWGQHGEKALVRVLLTHALEIFPEEYAEISRSTSRSNSGQPGPSITGAVRTGVIARPIPHDAEEFSKIEASLSAAMKAVALCLIRDPERFTDGIDVSAQGVFNKHPILRSLPSDFSSLKLDYAVIISFLKYYLIRQVTYDALTAETACYLPRIPLLPANINGSLWNAMTELCLKASGNEDPQDRSNDEKILFEGLQSHFALQPLCVKEFICFLSKFGGKKNWLNKDYFDFYITASFLPVEGDGPLRPYNAKDSLLVNFIITNAHDLFPNEYAEFTKAMVESAIEFPEPTDLV